MKPNLSPMESDVRGMLLAPIALLAAVGLGVTTLAGVVLFALAVILLVTAITGYDPVYALFHIDHLPTTR